MKQFALTLLFTLVPLLASATSVEIDGIWYNLVSKTQTAEVAKKNKKKCKVQEERGDSVRVLEWVQCTVCWGSGACPVCKKYGKKYDGTKLTTCPECLGDGRCRHCFGKGGDHYYVWKHKSEATK